MQIDRERLKRGLTRTLRHHGVEMHPDDIRGLVQDVLTDIEAQCFVIVPREPTEAMVEAVIYETNIRDIWSAMIDAAKGGEG